MDHWGNILDDLIVFLGRRRRHEEVQFVAPLSLSVRLRIECEEIRRIRTGGRRTLVERSRQRAGFKICLEDVFFKRRINGDDGSCSRNLISCVDG